MFYHLLDLDFTKQKSFQSKLIVIKCSACCLPEMWKLQKKSLVQLLDKKQTTGLHVKLAPCKIHSPGRYAYSFFAFCYTMDFSGRH